MMRNANAEQELDKDRAPFSIVSDGPSEANKAVRYNDPQDIRSQMVAYAKGSSHSFSQN